MRPECMTVAYAPMRDLQLVYLVRAHRSRHLQRCNPQEMGYIEQETSVRFRIKEGMVPGMRVPGKFYVNDRLKSLIFDELHAATQRGGQGGFLPAIKQIANVAALPGIVRVSGCIPIYGSLTSWCAALLLGWIWSEFVAADGCPSSDGGAWQESIALPDVHSGYGFAIGNVAAFDMSNPEAVVSPGGVDSTSTVAYA